MQQGKSPKPVWPRPVPTATGPRSRTNGSCARAAAERRSMATPARSTVESAGPPSSGLDQPGPSDDSHAASGAETAVRRRIPVDRVLFFFPPPGGRVPAGGLGGGGANRTRRGRGRCLRNAGQTKVTNVSSAGSVGPQTIGRVRPRKTRHRRRRPRDGGRSPLAEGGFRADGSDGGCLPTTTLPLSSGFTEQGNHPASPPAASRPASTPAPCGLAGPPPVARRPEAPTTRARTGLVASSLSVFSPALRPPPSLLTLPGPAASYERLKISEFNNQGFLLRNLSTSAWTGGAVLQQSPKLGANERQTKR